MRERWLGLAALLVGAMVLWLAATHTRTPVRPVLTLVFFATAPGIAVVSLLRPRDVLLAASLVVAVSVAVTILIAQSMLWIHRWSPTAAVVVVLALVLASTAAPLPGKSEAGRREAQPR
jgi:uncharacterized membrane protein